MSQDKPTPEQLTSILKQMKELDRMYIDYSLEYEEGLNQSFRYNKEEQEFQFVLMNVAVGGLYEVSTYTEEQMKIALSEYTVQELRDSTLEF